MLLTGPTGSGKSTTLAAMVDHNNIQPSAIITIEDPVEYYHETKESLINQRELGQHAQFCKQCRSAIAEDPDVILVGEMRGLGNHIPRAYCRRDRASGSFDLHTPVP